MNINRDRRKPAVDPSFWMWAYISTSLVWVVVFVSNLLAAQ